MTDQAGGGRGRQTAGQSGCILYCDQSVLSSPARGEEGAGHCTPAQTGDNFLVILSHQISASVASLFY